MIVQLKPGATRDLCGPGAGLLKLRAGPPPAGARAGHPVPALLPANAVEPQGSHRALPWGSQKLTGRRPSVPFAWRAPWDHPKSEGGVGAELTPGISGAGETVQAAVPRACVPVCPPSAVHSCLSAAGWKPQAGGTLPGPRRRLLLCPPRGAPSALSLPPAQHPSASLGYLRLGCPLERLCICSGQGCRSALRLWGTVVWLMTSCADSKLR